MCFVKLGRNSPRGKGGKLPFLLVPQIALPPPTVPIERENVAENTPSAEQAAPAGHYDGWKFIASSCVMPEKRGGKYESTYRQT